MELYNAISKDSVIHEAWRICNINANAYPIRDVVARVNSALDRYLHLAFRADGRWNFDDVNETSPSIDTQNIVSGTNRYKFSAFTETILNLIRLEILDSDGEGLSLTPERIEDVSIFQQLYIDADSGTPTHYIKYGDFIYLRPNPDYSETDGLIAYFNRPASKFNFTVYTQTIANPSVFTSTAHGLAVNDTVMLETDGALPTNFSVDTVYYVKTVPTVDTFTLAATLGGTAIEGAGSQSGIHYFVETSKVPGIPVIHHPYLARYAALPFLIEKGLPSESSIRKQIGSDNPRDPYYGGDELAIVEYFANRDKDSSKGMTPLVENNK